MLLFLLKRWLAQFAADLLLPPSIARFTDRLMLRILLSEAQSEEEQDDIKLEQDSQTEESIAAHLLISVKLHVGLADHEIVPIETIPEVW